MTAIASPHELCAEALKRLRSDLPAARQLAGQAARIARRDPEPEVWRTIGHIHYLSGRYRPALRDYGRAARIAREREDWADLGKTLTGALQTLAYLGRYAEAEEWAREARAIFEREGDELRLARLDSNLANVLHRRDRAEEALALYESALARLIAAGDRDNAAITLRNLAVCATTVFDFPRAMAAYDKARAFYDSRGWKHLTAEVLDNVAYLHYLRGDYSRAIAAYQDARRTSAERGNAYYQAIAELDQSDLYLELNLFSEAAEYAARAAARLDKAGTGYEAAKAAMNRAVALGALGRRKEAESGLEAAREIFLRERNPAWAAAADLYRAVLRANAGEADEAEIERLEVELGRGPLRGKAALAALMLATSLYRRRSPEAQAVCERAAEHLREAPNRSLDIQVKLLEGRIAEREGDGERARDRYRAAHLSIRDTRHRLPHDQLKVAFCGDKAEAYEALTALAIGEGRVEEAFQMAQEAKSRGLADWLSFRSDFAPAAGAAGFVAGEEVQALRKELAWHSRELERAESAERREAVHRRVQKIEEKLGVALNTLRRVDPAFLELQGAPDVVVEDLQRALGTEEAIFDYAVARGELYVFRLTRGGLDRRALGPVAPISAAARRVRFQIGRGAAGGGALAHHLESLYRALAAPVEGWLRASKPIVCLPPSLAGLPFHALPDATGTPLIERGPMVYSLSATVHSLVRRAPAESAGALVVGVADERAPQIAEEAAAVARMLPGASLLTGVAATKEELLRRAVGKRWIHVATHGLFREDNPMFSSIALGDGPFSLFDFYDLRLSADLATLSGCFTGLGAGTAGGEFLGLTRGLLFAGARAVQVGLWQIDDRSAREYMESFYGRLTAGEAVADAWRDSVLDLRARYAHPYYWAPYMVME